MKEKEQPVLVNRIAQSGLEVIKLEALAPTEKLFDFDIGPFLVNGFLLKEKEFRAAMKSFDWSSVKDHIVCLHCSIDAVIPKWAYMLVTKYATPVAIDIFFGPTKGLYDQIFSNQIESVDWSQYKDARVILKGCSDGIDVPESAYIAATKKLLPIAKSIMYGEPCSTVPVYKRPK